MGLPAFSSKHFNTIKNLSDARNSFVHYKFHSEDADKLGDSNEKTAVIKRDFLEIYKAVLYMKKYDANILYKGKKSKVSNFVSQKEKRE